MKIVVLDDDPTGSQTVHSCPLLLSWEFDALCRGLRHESPLLFILANTRALLPAEAAGRISEICFVLKRAILAEGLSLNNIFFVSRGDSTLRGHGVLEPSMIAGVFGPFDATLHIPAFFQGGRTTVDGIHLLNGKPVHTTSFAKDRLFAYSTSNLAEWLNEKSSGQIDPCSVKRISLSLLDKAAAGKEGMNALEAWLESCSKNQNVIVDAVKSSQLDALAEAVRNLTGKKRFLFRSAASFLNSLSCLAPQILEESLIANMRRKDEFGNPLPGMVIVGSYVSLADAQLQKLLEGTSCHGVEIPVSKLADLYNQSFKDSCVLELESELLSKIENLLADGKTPVLYTTRGEWILPTLESRVLFGCFLAQFIAKIISQLALKLGYLISKGGITSNVLLKEGFGVESVDLKGQIFPGLSLVIASLNERNIHMPVITFPGNLGDSETLLRVWRLVDSC